jgi:hypothetical protein
VVVVVVAMVMLEKGDGRWVDGSGSCGGGDAGEGEEGRMEMR